MRYLDARCIGIGSIPQEHVHFYVVFQTKKVISLRPNGVAIREVSKRVSLLSKAVE